MALYEKTNWLKAKLIVLLTTTLLISLVADKWIIYLVREYLTSLVFVFKQIESFSDSITNKLTVSILISSLVGLIISALFKNQKWSTFFLSWLIVLLVSAVITNYLKIHSGRIRPEMIIDEGWGQMHQWFAGGDSFPSGHTSFYFSLLFPFYYYFDKTKFVLVIPIIIAVGRLIQRAHFLSDIIMSILIVVSLTILIDLTFTWVTERVKKLVYQNI